MIEKVILLTLTILFGALGWLIKEMLSDIKGTQKEHGKSLGNIREHVLRIEDKQATVEVEVSRLKDAVISNSNTQRETKSVLDHGLYEMRQQIKEQADEQYQQKQNFGKIILIVQKLYAATRNGAGK